MILIYWKEIEEDQSRFCNLHMAGNKTRLSMKGLWPGKNHFAYHGPRDESRGNLDESREIWINPVKFG